MRPCFHFQLRFLDPNHYFGLETDAEQAALMQ
jgi:hypothetical protein